MIFKLWTSAASLLEHISDALPNYIATKAVILNESHLRKTMKLHYWKHAKVMSQKAIVQSVFCLLSVRLLRKSLSEEDQFLPHFNNAYEETSGTLNKDITTTTVANLINSQQAFDQE